MIPVLLLWATNTHRCTYTCTLFVMYFCWLVCVSLWGWLILLHIKFSVASTFLQNSSFHLPLWMYIILLCICTRFSLSSESTDGHLAWFLSLAIEGSIAINTNGQISLCSVDSESLKYTHRTAVTESWSLCLQFFFFNFCTDFHCNCVQSHSLPPWESGQWGFLFPPNSVTSVRNCFLGDWVREILKSVFIFQVAKHAGPLFKMAVHLFFLF